MQIGTALWPADSFLASDKSGLIMASSVPPPCGGNKKPVQDNAIAKDG
jgi:hypothetical protein